MGSELPVSFLCNDSRLYGLIHLPDKPFRRGILIVVGGPQYRVGSHRQFVLLARVLAAYDIPVMRFDYRGMGDSEGEQRNFEYIEEDISSAIEFFFSQVPSLQEVVLWGLCDAASAALIYAQTDKRVSGLVLLNPWVRSEQGIAKAYLKYYYIKRIINPMFWKKIVNGDFDFKSSIKSLFSMLSASAGFNDNSKNQLPIEKSRSNSYQKKNTQQKDLPFTDSMLNGLINFQGNVLLILSGDDLTASEFKDFIMNSKTWRRALRKNHVTRYDLEAANHTFSNQIWREQVSEWTKRWIKSW